MHLVGLCGAALLCRACSEGAPERVARRLPSERRPEELSYVITNYGMIGSPRQELRREAEERLCRLGCDELAVREADSLADAAVDVMVSDYPDRARFDRLAEELRDRAWLDHLDYPMTGFLRWRRYGNYHPGYFRTELSYARRLSGLEAVEAQTSGAAR